jgi:hypothetical protein
MSEERPWSLLERYCSPVVNRADSQRHSFQSAIDMGKFTAI